MDGPASLCPLRNVIRYQAEATILNDAKLEQQAIDEPVQIEPYDAGWPGRFQAERSRLLGLIPNLLTIEHIGSTAVPGLAAMPIIDIMATVPAIEVADEIVVRLCANGYITSADFNRLLGDHRWLMRHANGRRTHHLHLFIVGSPHWVERIRFRDLLRQDGSLCERYAELKRLLAAKHGPDRDGYGNAKTEFIIAAVRSAG